MLYYTPISVSSYANKGFLKCGLLTCLGFVWSHWILQTIRRSEMRQQFGIKGNCCGDCCTVFCCGCCAIIQEEKEAELRTRPASQAAYQTTPGMAYPHWTLPSTLGFLEERPSYNISNLCLMSAVVVQINWKKISPQCSPGNDYYVMSHLTLLPRVAHY